MNQRRWSQAVIGAILIAIFSASTLHTYAANAILQVNGSSGTIMTGNPCPTPRTSATYKHIQAAITCAEGGDTLVIAAGMYTENLTIAKSLSLQGASAATTTLNGSGVGRVLTVTGSVNVALSGFTLTNGTATDGGGVHTSASTLTFTNAAIQGNTATGRGGGLFTAAGTVTLTNSVVSLNNAPNGGGIYALAGTVKVIGGSVTGNTATGSGGGIYTQAGTITRTTNAIAGNTAGTGAQIHTVVGAITDATVINTQVVLQGRQTAPNSTWVTPLQITIIPATGGEAIFDQQVITDDSGTFTVLLMPGTYKMRVKGVHTLARVVTTTLVAGINTVEIPILLEGDANGDNLVNILDFSLLATAFGKTSDQVGFNAFTDFNADSLINIIDFSLLATNFSKSSETF